ncbi:hypothetical protein EXX51_22430 [Escherichia coli]|nr:hypothetical protein EXX51_22430 [Escherichia coli]
MFNTIADQIHFHRRKTCAPVQDGIEHHGQVFVVLIEPTGVLAFLHDQAKAARLAGHLAVFAHVADNLHHRGGRNTGLR